MDWRWRGRSARPSLQRTSKASTKGAVKEAAMVKLPLLCSELVLQAMKVIFSGRQGKSADGWSSSLAQKSVGTYNWLMHIPHLSQHGSSRGAGRAQKKKKENTLVSPETHLTVYISAGPAPLPRCRFHFLDANVSSPQAAEGHADLLPVAVSAVDITSIDSTQWGKKNTLNLIFIWGSLWMTSSSLPPNTVLCVCLFFFPAQLLSHQCGNKKCLWSQCRKKIFIAFILFLRNNHICRNPTCFRDT